MISLYSVLRSFTKAYVTFSSTGWAGHASLQTMSVTIRHCLQGATAARLQKTQDRIMPDNLITLGLKKSSLHWFHVNIKNKMVIPQNSICLVINIVFYVIILCNCIRTHYVHISTYKIINESDVLVVWFNECRIKLFKFLIHICCFATMIGL